MITYKNVIFIENLDSKFIEKQGRALELFCKNYGNIDSSWITYFLNCCAKHNKYILALEYYDKLKNNHNFSLDIIFYLMKIYKLGITENISKVIEYKDAVLKLHNTAIINTRSTPSQSTITLQYNIHTGKLFKQLGLKYIPI